MKKNVILFFTLVLFSCSVNEIKNDEIDTLGQALSFPNDHGFHKNINEWVYFSGIVNTDKNKQLGFMFTVFQFRQPIGGYTFLSNIAIIDFENSEYYKYENNNVVVENFTQNGSLIITIGSSEVNWDNENNIFITGKWNTENLDQYLIEMNLVLQKNVLLHNKNGFIKMGDGFSSAYYSYTNVLPENGKIILGNEKFDITNGRVWIDRQWGDWTTNGNKWDWFSFRLEGGESVMIYRFRDFSGNPSFSYWTFRDNHDNILFGQDITINTSRVIKNYPVDWEINLPELNAQFSVSPIFDNQVFNNFWEGICNVEGTINGNQKSGYAFVELVGYD